MSGQSDRSGTPRSQAQADVWQCGWIGRSRRRDSWISASRRGGELDGAGLRSARSVLLRPRGLEPSGDGLERSDQLLELQRLQSVVRSFCEGVGQ